MENFETVKKSTIVNSQGVKYTEFRAGLIPNYALVWTHIGLGYLALLLTGIASMWLNRFFPSFFYLNVPISALLLGYEIAYIQLFIHEAAHFNVAPNPRQNDLLANIFFGLIVGVDIQFYRLTHFDHHKYHGTTRDTEKTYFDALNWQFIIESITGIRVIKVMKNRHKQINDKEHTDENVLKRNRKMFFMGISINFILLTALFFNDFWQTGFAWLIGMGVVFPFFASVRQLLEHRDDNAEANIDYNNVNHGLKTRIFGDGILASTLGGAGFNRHLLHHWDPKISYTRLKEVEDFLQDSAYKTALKNNSQTYVKTFIKLFKN